jgi:hypothetical protein
MIMNRRWGTPVRGAGLLLALVAVAGCGGTEETAQPDGAEGASELPPGHPPVEGMAPSAAVQPPPEGSGSGSTALQWDAPRGWEAEPPSSEMRRAQYRIGEQAECVVYYFGPGQGGTAEANAEMWADQFTQPDGSSSRSAMTTKELEVGGIDVLLVEVAGTYGGGMGAMGDTRVAREDHMLLGAVAEGPDANWFFKLTGPRETVVEQRAAFEGMIQSLRRGE